MLFFAIGQTAACQSFSYSAVTKECYICKKKFAKIVTFVSRSASEAFEWWTAEGKACVVLCMC